MSEHNLRLIRPTTIGHTVQSDAMDIETAESIRRGDTLLVDTALTEPVDGGVYLVNVTGCGRAIGRLRLEDGRKTLTSDNPEGPTWSESEFTIVGRAYSRIPEARPV